MLIYVCIFLIFDQICWKFQGPKYELAKKLKIIIVNHRWIEDSVRQGRRLPETSYTARWYAIVSSSFF